MHENSFCCTCWIHFRNSTGTKTGRLNKRGQKVTLGPQHIWPNLGSLIQVKHLHVQVSTKSALNHIFLVCWSRGCCHQVAPYVLQPCSSRASSRLPAWRRASGCSCTPGKQAMCALHPDTKQTLVLPWWKLLQLSDVSSSHPDTLLRRTGWTCPFC